MYPLISVTVIWEYVYVFDTGIHNLGIKGKFLFFQIKMYKSDYLTINGKNLDRAAQEIDVEVRIGEESCNVTSLSRSQLTCRPPKEQPAPNKNNDLPLVVVSVWKSFFSEHSYGL